MQIFLSAVKLANLDNFDDSDPFAELLIKSVDEEEWTSLGKTETVDNNLNPNWVTHFDLAFDFLKDKQIKIIVFDEDDSGDHDVIGSIETTLSEIIKADKWCLKK